MMYCPHCNKPSARKSGPCPHCKGELSAKRGTAFAPQPAAGARAPAATKAAPSATAAPTSTAKPRSPGENAGEMVNSQTDARAPRSSSSMVARSSANHGARASQAQMTVEHSHRASSIGREPAIDEGAQASQGKMIIEHTRVDRGEVDVQAGSLVNRHGMADWEAVSDDMQRASSGLEIDSDSAGAREIELVAFEGESQLGGPTQNPAHSGASAHESDEEPVLALDSLPPDVSDELTEEGAGIDVVLSAQEIAEIARYGVPNAGPIGALMYWKTVYLRKKALVEELGRAEAQYDEAEQKKRDALAFLGRQLEKREIQDNYLKDLIGKASLAQAELRGKERHHSHLSQEHKEKLNPLEARLAILEKEAEPLRAEETKIQKEHDALMVKCRHVETKKKRFQIDLRNMDELIGKRQEVFHNPESAEEEKDKAFQEINQFERRRPGLIEEVEACDKALEELSVPVSGVEAQLVDIRAKIQEKNDAIQGVVEQMNQLSQEFARVEGAAAQEVHIEAEKVETAWAAVGTKILADNANFPELNEKRNQTINTIAAAKKARRKHALFVAAIDSYDHGTVQLAKKTAYMVLAGVIILIALAIFFG